METSEKLVKLPDGIEFPEDLKNKIRYDNSNHLLIFKGIMSQEEKNRLLNLSTDDPYKKAIEALFQRSHMEGDDKRNLRFYGWTQSIILGLLLVETSMSLCKEFNPYNYRFIIQLTAILIFLELYIVLGKHHGDLNIEYRPFYLFYDLFFLGLPFIVLITLIKISWEQKENYTLIIYAIRVFLVIFILLFLRQLLNYYSLDKDKRSKYLWIPMVADLFGVFVCIFAGRALLYDTCFWMGITFWSWFGFCAFLGYFALSRIIKLNSGIFWNKLKELRNTIGLR